MLDMSAQKLGKGTVMYTVFILAIELQVKWMHATENNNNNNKQTNKQSVLCVAFSYGIKLLKALTVAQSRIFHFYQRI